MEKERLAVYLRSLEKDLPPFLFAIEDRAIQDRIPIIRRETASFLSTVLRMKAPARILEVGTAVGYSACTMCLSTDFQADIDTIEKSEANAVSARNNFRILSGYYDEIHGGPETERTCISEDIFPYGAHRIRLMEGDASDVLKKLDTPYDLIFMDAAKGQYLTWLPEVLRLLKPEGVLITDNVLQEETVLESRFAVTRRDRTIHARMREYLWQLKHRDDLQTCILNVGDGVALTVLTGGRMPRPIEE